VPARKLGVPGDEMNHEFIEGARSAALVPLGCVLLLMGERSPFSGVKSCITMWCAQGKSAAAAKE